MIALIDDHRGVYGGEPLCKALPIAPSTYHAHAARRLDPSKLSVRAKQDAALIAQIRRIVAFVTDAYTRGGLSAGVRHGPRRQASFRIREWRPLHRGRLVHHSDRGSQYVLIKYTERLRSVLCMIFSSFSTNASLIREILTFDFPRKL